MMLPLLLDPQFGSPVEEYAAIDVVLAVEQDTVALKIEHGELKVDPLHDLGVANGQVGIARSVRNGIAEKPGSYAEPIKQLDRNGSRSTLRLRCGILEAGINVSGLECQVQLRMLNRRGLVISERQLGRLVLNQVAQRGGDRKSRVANLWVS